jgi:hypothetical protein
MLAPVEPMEGRMVNRPQSGLYSGLSVKALLRAMGRVPTAELTATESASTLFRFFRSKHVRDLKLIFAAALFVLLSHLIVVFLLGLGSAAHAFVKPAPDLWDRFFAATSAFFSFMITYVGPAIPVYGVIVGWAYQSASSRLGIVDLFGCEIGTLCRVGTIFDVGKRYIDDYKSPPVEKYQGDVSRNFVSAEEYFPVFENNSRDLQLLEASVVNNITQFYTYMKATRDAQRRLAATAPPGSEQASATTTVDKAGPDHPWRVAVANVIYLLFLGYESARKAIKDLIEFQPDRAERLIVILLTELRCYAFLRQYFKPDDLRSRRLQLRAAVYKQEVPELYLEVTSNQANEDWLQARETLSELEARYEEALGEKLTTAASRLTQPPRIRANAPSAPIAAVPA